MRDLQVVFPGEECAIYRAESVSGPDPAGQAGSGPAQRP